MTFKFQFEEQEVYDCDEYNENDQVKWYKRGNDLKRN